MGQQVIGGRYEVLSRIGKGGMASVYRARDVRLLRDVAVKLLEAGSHADSTYYFHREARAIAALRHQNIVQIYDYSGPDEAPAYIVMELVWGGNADEMLLVHHPLPQEVIAAAAFAVASALQHAHEQGVIHRDIKPANVMVEKTGRLLLTDFGIAKAYADDKRLGDTFSGRNTQLFGTPDFMAPEQVLERAVGPHTDVFALGCLVYCLATNGSPFEHPEPVEILRRVVDVEYRPLAEARPDLDPGLVQLVRSCLTPEPEGRPTAGEVVACCEDLLFRLRVPSPQRVIFQFLQGEPAAPLRPGERDERPSNDTDPVLPERADVTAPHPDPFVPGDRTAPMPALPVRGPDVTLPEAVVGGDTGPVGGDTVTDVSLGPPRGAKAEATVEVDPRGVRPRRSEVTEIAPGWSPRGTPTDETAVLSEARLQHERRVSSARPRERVATPVRPVQRSPRRGRLWISTLLALSAAGAAGAWLAATTSPPPTEITATSVPAPADAPQPRVGSSVTAAPRAPAGPKDPQDARALEGDARHRQRVAPAEIEGRVEHAERVGSAEHGQRVEPPLDGRPAAPTGAAAAPGEEAAAARDADGAPAGRAKARARRRAPRGTRGSEASGGQPATLYIIVRPWGTVTIDGREHGNTPMVREVSVPPGRHRVSITHPSLGEQSRSVTVGPGDELTLSFDLRRR